MNCKIIYHWEPCNQNSMSSIARCQRIQCRIRLEDLDQQQNLDLLKNQAWLKELV